MTFDTSFARSMQLTGNSKDHMAYDLARWSSVIVSACDEIDRLRKECQTFRDLSDRLYERADATEAKLAQIKSLVDRYDSYESADHYNAIREIRQLLGAGK